MLRSLKQSLRRAVADTPMEIPLAHAWWAIKRTPLRKRSALLNDIWTFQIIRRSTRKNSTCVDIGCNVGKILSEMVRCAPAGRHFAFEPVPHLYRSLVERFPGVEVRSEALSDHEGVAEFEVVKGNNALSGLRHRSHVEQKFEIERVETRVTRLDDCLPEDLPIDLIKIDVEGGEVDCLAGARRTLERWKPVVVFEHTAPMLAAYGSSSAQLFDLLRECGLGIYLLDDWLGKREPLEAGEFPNPERIVYVAAPRP